MLDQFITQTWKYENGSDNAPLSNTYFSKYYSTNSNKDFISIKIGNVISFQDR